MLRRDPVTEADHNVEQQFIVLIQVGSLKSRGNNLRKWVGEDRCLASCSSLKVFQNREIRESSVKSELRKQCC